MAVFCTKQALQTQESSGFLKVSLYYEALCPACRQFITGQLYPGYLKIGSSLQLDLVPYGNIERKKVNGTWEFDCQHGPAECAINKIEACGLAKSNDQDSQMEFVYCVESRVETESNNLEALAECATRLGLTASEILECSEGPEGNKLLAKLGDKQNKLKPTLQFVPWIIFNDKYDNKTQNEAMDNFLKTACDLLSDKPDGCAGFNEIPTDEY